MMKRTQMSIEDFLAIMEANRGIYPEYDRLTDEQKRFVANVNICSGTAETFYDDDGNLIGVGGIRYIGVGEAWFLTLPSQRRPYLLRLVAEQYARIRDEKNLWRIFAESKISENFLAHLGFEKKDGMFCYTRT